MAIRALDLSKVEDFTVSTDDGDDPTIFKVGVLTSRDVGRIRDSVTNISFKSGGKDKGDDDEQDINTSIERSKMNFEAVRRGLRGWENFIGSDDKPVEYKTHVREIDGKQRTVCRPELLDMLPLPVITELADKILGDNEVSEDDLGN